jgi:YwiC-like protein
MSLLIPREHGAWAMLLLPFLSALALARKLEWEIAPAFVAALLVFLVREPLVVLWRQAAIWKDQRPETTEAWRSLACYAPALAVAAALLFWRLPAGPLIALGLMAGALLLVSTYLVVHNRRRSVGLQVSSAAGLSASAVLAWLSVRPQLEEAVLWLWGLQFAHSTAAVLAVHARLEARLAARAPWNLDQARRRAVVAQALLLAGAALLGTLGKWGMAAALALSGGVHSADLWRLRNPRFVEIPLRRVGLRELALSTLVSAMLLVGLWGAVRHQVGELAAEALRDMAVPANGLGARQQAGERLGRNLAPLEGLAVGVHQGGPVLQPIAFSDGLTAQDAGLTGIPAAEHIADQAIFRRRLNLTETFLAAVTALRPTGTVPEAKVRDAADEQRESRANGVDFDSGRLAGFGTGDETGPVVPAPRGCEDGNGRVDGHQYHKGANDTENDGHGTPPTKHKARQGPGDWVGQETQWREIPQAGS